MLELADTSAWFGSRRDAELRATFDSRLIRGDIATCDMVKLEVLHAARNAAEVATRRSELDALPQCLIGPDEWERALDVCEALAQQGGAHHRRVKHADLLIAAAAEAAGVGLLHYDEDYDAIVEVTGQPARWLAPRGSI
jgi:hypothetical protein